jgi:hypothetical protein
MNDRSSSCANWTITLRYRTKKLKAIIQKKAITYSPAAAPFRSTPLALVHHTKSNKAETAKHKAKYQLC